MDLFSQLAEAGAASGSRTKEDARCRRAAPWPSQENEFCSLHNQISRMAAAVPSSMGVGWGRGELKTTGKLEDSLGIVPRALLLQRCCVGWPLGAPGCGASHTCAHLGDPSAFAHVDLNSAVTARATCPWRTTEERFCAVCLYDSQMSTALPCRRCDPCCVSTRWCHGVPRHLLRPCGCLCTIAVCGFALT